jgi:hypothetical protein
MTIRSLPCARALAPQGELEKPKAFKCGTFGHSTISERHLATGDFAGGMAIWDLERLQDPIFACKGHETIINCIDGCGGLKGAGAPEIATGGRDGAVHVWDPRQQDRPVASMAPDEGAPVRDCWAVAFGDAHSADSRVVAAGYDNGDVKILDLVAGKMRFETNVSNGVCGIEFDRKDIEMNKLLLTTLESRFRLYDMCASSRAALSRQCERAQRMPATRADPEAAPSQNELSPPSAPLTPSALLAGGRSTRCTASPSCRRRRTRALSGPRATCRRTETYS